MEYNSAPSTPRHKMNMFGLLYHTDKTEYQSLRRDSKESATEAVVSIDHSPEDGFVTPPRRKGRRRGYLICGSLWALAILAALLLIDLLLAISRVLWGLDDDPDKIFANWGKPGTGTEDLAWYPTDFLRDVPPIRCHSHNDYWRTVPLFSALHAGCIGTEADVWLFGNDTKLYVGHDRASLTATRTFESLYINPLVEILNRTNPRTEFFDGTNSRNGVFDVDRDQSLTLLVDFKTDGAATWPHVVAQLEPLRKRGWLSYVQDGVRHDGPITVVGTGNTPFDQVIANATYRDVFFDAPLDEMWEDPDRDGDGDAGDNGETLKYNSTNSHYASVSFGKTVGSVLGGFSEAQLRTLRGQVKGAHRRGLKARYWDLPAWPIGLRNSVWHILMTDGVDLLNVDDLRSASRKEW